jgi:hypothetical protein
MIESKIIENSTNGSKMSKTTVILSKFKDVK